MQKASAIVGMVEYFVNERLRIGYAYVNTGGRQIKRLSMSDGLLNVSTKGWSTGLYMVQVIEVGRVVKVAKLLKVE